MFYCERCGEADCCERFDLPTEPVLCDACYENATREKLIDVFMHIGDHITNRDEYGICFDTSLAKAIEDVLAMLKSQDAHGTTVQEWISVKDRLPDRNDMVIAFYPTMRGTSGEMQIHRAWAMSETCTHWMPLPQPPVDFSRMFENVSNDDLRSYREKTQPPKGE